MTTFLKATYASAAHSVCINGKSSRPFRLEKSVRQGGPLSPLLFLIAIDALSEIFNQEVSAGRLEGVRLEEIDSHTAHNLFAYNLTLLLTAERRFITCCQSFMDSFKKASGLYCDWDNTAAALVPYTATPMQFVDLGWKWENSAEASKLLGIHTAQQILEEQMNSYLDDKLEGRISQCHRKHSSFMARVTLAIHFIMSTLWYSLTLWTGKVAALERMEKKIVNFVWSGQGERARAKVKLSMITLSRQHGGLGLLLLPQQVRALAGSLFIWALQEGDHPLRKLIQYRLRKLSYDR